MAIDDSMLHASKVWYRIFWGVMVGINAVILAGYFAAKFIPQAAEIGAKVNLQSSPTLALSALTLGYLLTLYWVLQRKAPATATFFGTSLNALVLLNGITNTEPSAYAYIYISIWIITAWMTGMYGLPMLYGAALVSAIYVLILNDFDTMRMSTAVWVMLAGSLVSVGIGIAYWRRNFLNTQKQQMSQLSGMLRTNQTQSAILIQSIADGVIVTNTNGQITLMNRAAANMTGWTTEEAAGVDVKLVVKLTKEDGSDLSDEEYPFTAVLVHKAFINHAWQIISQNGRKMVISLVISPVVTPKGEVYGAVAVLRDISEQRAAERQSAEFISTASHEMRTPVAAIEGYLALALNDKVSTIDSRARGFLEKAHSSTQHLGQLFQDLLTSAKAEDGRLANHPIVIEMGGYLEQLAEDLRFAAQKKGLDTEFIVGTNEAIDATKSNDEGRKMIKPLYYVYADPDRIREVLTNLFDNAVKYTDSGKISIGLTGNAEVVQIYIRDTGAGIPPEDIPHLFQKFYRVDSSATRTIGGTGLGLFISRKIIELYQGRVWVESELGKGSTFFINLPRLSNQRADDLQKTAAQTAPPPQVG